MVNRTALQVCKSTAKVWIAWPAVPLLIAALAGIGSGRAQAFSYDLRGDWSNTANPNLPWSYNDGAGPIPGHVSDYLPGAFSMPQPAWANATSGSNPGHIVSWLRAVTNGSDVGCPPCDSLDWRVGDVITHTWDRFSSGISTANSNLSWTSPGSGRVTISGAVWLARNIGRAVDWEIAINGLAVSTGSLYSGDPYNRSHPFVLASGSGGAAALTHVPVQSGDRIVLSLITPNTSPAGEFVGVDLRIETASTPVPGPLSVAGLAAAFRQSRQWRRRCRRVDYLLTVAGLQGESVRR